MRRIATYLAAVTITAVAGGCQSAKHQDIRHQAEQDWTQLRGDIKFRLATQQIEAGQFAAATKTLEEAIALKPTAQGYYHAMARCRLAMDDTRAAAEALDRSEAAGDASAELAYLRGLAAEQDWRIERALRYYRIAIALDPRSVDALIAAAQCLTSLGRPVEARSLVTDRLDASGRDDRLILLRAEICTILEDYDCTANDYAELGGALSDNRMAAEQHARALMRLGRHAEAIAVLRAFLDGGTSALASHMLAESYVAVGKPGQARRMLLQHTTDHPTDARAWWLLADAAIRTGDAKTVRRCLRQGRALAPERPHWDILSAYLACQDNDRVRAAHILDATAKKHPDDLLVRSFLGEIRRQEDSAPTPE